MSNIIEITDFAAPELDVESAGILEDHTVVQRGAVDAKASA